MNVGDLVLISPDVTFEDTWVKGTVIKIEDNSFVGKVVSTQTDDGDVFFSYEDCFVPISGAKEEQLAKQQLCSGENALIYIKNLPKQHWKIATEAIFECVRLGYPLNDMEITGKAREITRKRTETILGRCKLWIQRLFSAESTI